MMKYLQKLKEMSATFQIMDIQQISSSKIAQADALVTSLIRCKYILTPYAALDPESFAGAKPSTTSQLRRRYYYHLAFQVTCFIILRLRIKVLTFVGYVAFSTLRIYAMCGRFNTFVFLVFLFTSFEGFANAVCTAQR